MRVCEGSTEPPLQTGLPASGNEERRDRVRLLLIIFAGLVAVFSAIGPSSSPGGGTGRAAASPLVWNEPPVNVRAPDPRTISAVDFGADIVNYDDMQWGPAAEAAWPSVALGIVRIWDDGTTWADIEPSPGQWNFSTLDRQVDQARMTGSQVLYVLGQTPDWASSVPSSGDIYGRGQPAPPGDLGYWEQYVSAVATRYKGRIAAYEVWDEADASTFFGSPQEMVQLARTAYGIIKRIDPRATVLTPSFTQNSISDGWLSAYLADGGGKVADAFAGHAYPNDPEAGAEYLLQYRAALRRAGLDLPIWITEVGYQGYSSSGRPLFSAGAAQTYVARTIMDLAEAGANRIIWYGANSNGMWLSLGEQGYPGDAQAYTTMVAWLTGSVPDGCGGFESGRYAGLTACYLTRPGGSVAVILYDSAGSISMRAPSKGAFTLTTLWGVREALSARSVVTIDSSPILVAPTR
jgi:polysaccharide biosynthesis protein PslG